MEYKNSDFVLQVNDRTPETEAIVNKYDAFLESITTDKYEHVRSAIREGVRFLVSNKYPTIDVLAKEHYASNAKMQAKYNNNEALYLSKFQMAERKSSTIDLATGTGKSWVIYGIAQIMLAVGLVDKVLVLCPSLTIEDGLKEKFKELGANQYALRILQELDASYAAPAIKSANDPILIGDICVENIHAVYERTGSSIRDSFLGKGDRTLVISDEAHHIFNPQDTATKLWLDFLKSSDFGFAYHIGVTGTAYIKDEYFHDVIYRYGLKKAMDEGIIKTIDYVVERAFDGAETQYEETYVNHQKLKEKYNDVLKPITIIVTAKIVECIEEWQKLVSYIAEEENISFETAKQKVIWITSGLPSNSEEKERAITALCLVDGETPEKVRTNNLQLLKTVDDPDNPVEYIISVAMLTEGWDVKNVFQIVPHSNRAFESKLLISQVLGRGLRIPGGLTPPIHVVVNNHERWTEAIGNLYKEVLEIENQITWGYDPQNEAYAFPLYILDYKEEQYTTESKKEMALEPTIATLHQQVEKRRQTVQYSKSGAIQYDVAVDGNIGIEEAARQIVLFLKEKDEELAKKWTHDKTLEFIKTTLRTLLTAEYEYVSAENLAIFKQAFGPLFRQLGKEVPRMRLKADKLKKIEMSQMAKQSFSEDALKTYGALFYPEQMMAWLSEQEKAIINKYISQRGSLRREDALPEVEYIYERFHPVVTEQYKSPLSAIYGTSGPEIAFIKSVITNFALFASFVKSPDKSFYSIPYSYKPTEEGSTHIKRSNFNPDFFLLKKDTKHILVVEIKDDNDVSQENKAKFRDAKEHFAHLNIELEKKAEEWKYYFYFLSPVDYAAFMDKVRSGDYSTFNSQLMQLLA